MVGSDTPASGWFSVNEGSVLSRALAYIPGFNSGAGFHDPLVGAIERSIGMQHWSATGQFMGGLVTNQMTILPAIGANYAALGLTSYDYYMDNILE